MVGDETIMRRILASYKLMLDFYGMRLENEATGLISRSENYTARYRNLCGTCFYPDTILQLRPRSWLGRHVLPDALRESPCSRNLILSVRPFRTPDDEPINDRSAFNHHIA